jgi:hypothetical protein
VDVRILPVPDPIHEVDLGAEEIEVIAGESIAIQKDPERLLLQRSLFFLGGGYGWKGQDKT